MTPPGILALAAAASGAAVVIGLLLIVHGARRQPVPPPVASRGRWGSTGGLAARRPTGNEAWRRWRWPLAAAAGIAAWLATGWVVAAPIAATTVVGLPILVATSRDGALAIDRVEAVEEWTRRLSDVLVVGVRPGPGDRVHSAELPRPDPHRGRRAVCPVGRAGPPRPRCAPSPTTWTTPPATSSSPP